MAISLPVSDSSTAGMFSSGASAKAADSGKFSRTLSREMAEQPEQDAMQTGSAQKAAGSGQADGRSQADSGENPADTDANASTENSAQHPAKAAAAGKGQKKGAAQGSDASTEAAAANVKSEDSSQANVLQMTADGDEKSVETTNGATVNPAALERTATASTNSVLANGSTNPALARSNAVRNDIFRSARALAAATPTVETYAESLSSGKSLQNGGKNLPVGKTDEAVAQLDSFLPAGTQDWKYTADALIAAVGDKAAKFDALNTRFNSQAAEAFSIFDNGTGKTPAAQSSFKSELAAQNATHTSLSSDFPAGSEEWCQDFGIKIEWMSKENVSKAELSLHPAELGVLDITINTEDDRISINIVAHNEKSREMLENSMPRLTELLKSQGLALENSNISHNSASDGQADGQDTHAQQQAGSFSLTPEEQQAAELGTMRSTLIRHQGQIDHYV